MQSASNPRHASESTRSVWLGNPSDDYEVQKNITKWRHMWHHGGMTVKGSIILCCESHDLPTLGKADWRSHPVVGPLTANSVDGILSWVGPSFGNVFPIAARHWTASPHGDSNKNCK